MMNKIFILLFVIIFTNRLNAQLEFFIKDLEVSQISMIIKENEFNEGEEEGPYVGGSLIFYNNSDSIYTLFPNKSKLTIIFNYDNMLYTNNVFTLGSFEEDKLILFPHEKKEYSFFAIILFGTNILKEKPLKIDKDFTLDYTKEMLEILPTIRIWYRDKNIDIKTTHIMNVKVEY